MSKMTDGFFPAGEDPFLFAMLLFAGHVLFAGVGSPLGVAIGPGGVAPNLAVKEQGVRGNAESEGSRDHNPDSTYRNRIQDQLYQETRQWMGNPTSCSIHVFWCL